MRRKTRRVAIAVTVILILVGMVIELYSYTTGPPPTQSLSFSIDWPTNAETQNALAYNGSMHIELVLFSNGSITQGQKVTAAAAGGLTSSFASQVRNVFLTFQGALPCVTKVCSQEGVIYNVGPTMLVLNKNEGTDSVAATNEIGPVDFTTSLGMGASWGNGEGIFWQSAGTYYVSMTIQCSNGSETAPFTLETDPVYVAPAPQGLSNLDIVVLVFLTIGSPAFGYLTGGIYLHEWWKQRQRTKRKQEKSEASFRQNVNRDNKEHGKKNQKGQK